MRRSLTIAGLMLAALSVAGCDTSSTSTSSASASKTGSMACTHWANVQGDIKAGILSYAEMRTKVNEVRSSATSPKVEKAATLLLSGITSKDKSEVAVGLVALNAACS